MQIAYVINSSQSFACKLMPYLCRVHIKLDKEHSSASLLKNIYGDQFEVY